jgi:hypothetical protein
MPASAYQCRGSDTTLQAKFTRFFNIFQLLLKLIRLAHPICLSREPHLDSKQISASTTSAMNQSSIQKDDQCLSRTIQKWFVTSNSLQFGCNLGPHILLSSILDGWTWWVLGFLSQSNGILGLRPATILCTICHQNERGVTVYCQVAASYQRAKDDTVQYRVFQWREEGSAIQVLRLYFAVLYWRRHGEDEATRL